MSRLRLAQRPSEGSVEAPSPSKAGQRINVPAVDGLRGMAALFVLLFHVWFLSGKPGVGEGLFRGVIASGYAGVDFFFVISGFLLFLPTAASGRFGDVRAYGLRRAARILPAYYFALCLTLVLFPLLLDAQVDLPHNSGRGLLSLVLHLLLLQHSAGLALGLPEGFVVNAVAWSLSLEAVFYLLLPMIAARFLRRPWLWLAGCLAVSAAWQMLIVSLPWSFDRAYPSQPTVAGMAWLSQFPTYLGHFVAGMAAAVLFVRWSAHPGFARRRSAAIPVQVVAIGVIVWALSRGTAGDLNGTAGLYDHWPAPYLVTGAFIALLLATSLAPPPTQLIFSNPLSRKLGEVSYGIFLWHLSLIGFATTTLGFRLDGSDGAFWALLGWTLPASTLLGWVSWRLVERPAIRWARRRSKSTRPIRAI